MQPICRLYRHGMYFSPDVLNHVQNGDYTRCSVTVSHAYYRRTYVYGGVLINVCGLVYVRTCMNRQCALTTSCHTCIPMDRTIGGRGRHTYGAVHVGSAEIHACMRRRSTRARTYTAYRERSKSSDRCAVVQVARCSSAEIYSEDVSSPRLPPIRCCANNDACRARRSTATSNLARRVGSLHQIRSVRDPRSERPLVTCIWGGVSVTASVDRYGIEKVREQCKHRSTRVPEGSYS
jgi:hypothetical protein